METEHTTVFGDARKMAAILDESIQLMVTSPPYPMIEMWDEEFGESNPAITDALNAEDGWKAFELMHEILDEIWAECFRVLCQSGFACINIGDATRSIGGEFALYTNRAMIDKKMIELGFTPLPSIIWRKQSNAPNKFMGSGTLPAGAYVTHEHEHILIYRKGGKRQFKSEEEKQVRRESAIFWEERNVWFSDLWGLKGTRQAIGDSADRERSAAYPFELPFRIIAMYSVKGDTVLDPFMGTGSTHVAAMTLGRNSIGYEIEPTLEATIEETLCKAVEWGQKRQQDRIDDHASFVEQREASGKSLKHFNDHHQMKVMSTQEKDLEIEESSESDYIHTFSASSGGYEGPEPDQPDPEPDDGPEVDRSDTSRIKGQLKGKVKPRIEKKLNLRAKKKLKGKDDDEGKAVPDGIQKIIDEINAWSSDEASEVLPEGVTVKPNSPGRLKFEREVAMNAVGTRTVQRPHAVGPLSELVTQSGAETKEDWIRFFFSRDVKVSSMKPIRELLIKKLSTDEEKYVCASCGYAGAKGKGLAYGGIDTHIKTKHKEIMTPEYFAKLVNILYESFQITEEECRLYLIDAVINRTWDGHIGETKVVEWIEKCLRDDPEVSVPDGFKLKKTDAKTDSAGQVDWYIECNDGDIGLQVKPEDSEAGPGIVGTDATSKHQEWEEERGGKVLWPKYIDGEAARNQQLIDDIKQEIDRLGGLKE